MNKKVVIAIVAVVVVLGALGGWFVLSNNKSDSTDMSSMNMSGSGSSSSSNKPAEATNAVTIQNFAFSPANITVKAGTTVTWTNKDSVAHTVTETDGKTGPDSGNVNPNSTYSFTFNTAGTYHYNCKIHPEMVGTVTVTE